MLKHKLLCNLMLLALLLPTWGIIVLAAKPPAPVPATSKGPVQDMIDSGLTRKQAIAYLSLIRDSKGRKIKNFSKYKGKEYRFAKGKPSYKLGKARLNAWLKWHRSHKKRVVVAKQPQKEVVSKTTPTAPVKPIATPTPTSQQPVIFPSTQKVEKKVLKIDLPVATLTLPINDPYDAPPAKAIYNDGTFEWIPKGMVESSNKAILSIGSNGHLLNLNKQGEADLNYSFGGANAKMHVIVGAENHRVRNMLFLIVLALVLIGSMRQMLNWMENRKNSKSDIQIEDDLANIPPVATPAAQASSPGVNPGSAPAP